MAEALAAVVDASAVRVSEQLPGVDVVHVVVEDAVRDFVIVPPQVVKHRTVAVTVPTGSMAIVAQSVFESKLHDADGPVTAGTTRVSHAGPIIADAGLAATAASAAAAAIDPPIRRIICAPFITVSPASFENCVRTAERAGR